MLLSKVESKSYVFKVGDMYVVSLLSDRYTLTQNLFEANGYTEKGRHFLRNLKQYTKYAEIHNLGELRVLEITKTVTQSAEDLSQETIEELIDNPF